VGAIANGGFDYQGVPGYPQLVEGQVGHARGGDDRKGYSANQPHRAPPARVFGGQPLDKFFHRCGTRCALKCQRPAKRRVLPP